MSSVQFPHTMLDKIWAYYLTVLSIFYVLLSVKEPIRDLVLTRIAHYGYHLLNLEKMNMHTVKDFYVLFNKTLFQNYFHVAMVRRRNKTGSKYLLGGTSPARAQASTSTKEKFNMKNEMKKDRRAKG